MFSIQTFYLCKKKKKEKHKQNYCVRQLENQSLTLFFI